MEHVAQVEFKFRYNFSLEFISNDLMATVHVVRIRLLIIKYWLYDHSQLEGIYCCH